MYMRSSCDKKCCIFRDNQEELWRVLYSIRFFGILDLKLTKYQAIFFAWKWPKFMICVADAAQKTRNDSERFSYSCLRHKELWAWLIVEEVVIQSGLFLLHGIIVKAAHTRMFLCTTSPLLIFGMQDMKTLYNSQQKALLMITPVR